MAVCVDYKRLFALAGKPDAEALAAVIVLPTPPFLAPMKIVLPKWFSSLFSGLNFSVNVKSVVFTSSVTPVLIGK